MDHALSHLKSRFVDFLDSEFANIGALDLSDAAAVDEQAKLKSIAHRIAGIAGMFGTDELQAVAEAAENALRCRCKHAELANTAQDLQLAIAASRKAFGSESND